MLPGTVLSTVGALKQPHRAGTNVILMRPKKVRESDARMVQLEMSRVGI